MTFRNSFIDDIYFTSEYCKLNELIEKGESQTFKFADNSGEISYTFIKRRIEHCNGEYYDIISPYGYGGPLIVSCVPEKKQSLCKKFESAFEEYCLNNNIISEFVRFHPIANNVADFKTMYDIVYLRKTVGTDLISYEEPVKDEFTKGCRKNIRRVLNNGVNFRITEAPNNIDTFVDIYYSTMRRDGAEEFYYFKKDYFDAMVKLFQKKLLFVEALYENKIIAAGVYFISNGTIHIHLSGTLSEYLYLSPAYLLRYATTLWGKENGYVLIHHGGGRTNSSDDTLYKFKKQFGVHTEFDFYIGKKIWNKAIYDNLCKGINEVTDFFPAYRARG